MTLSVKTKVTTGKITIKLHYGILILVTILLSVLQYLPTNAYAKATIRIIELSDYRGNPNISIAYRQGWQLAQEKLRKSSLLRFDPDIISIEIPNATSAARKAIDEKIQLNKPVAMFGTLNKDNSAMIRKIAERQKIPFFAAMPLFGNNRLVEKGNYSFIVRPSLSRHLAALAHFITLTSKAKNIAVLSEDTEDAKQAIEYYKSKIYGFNRADIIYENYLSASEAVDDLVNLPKETQVLVLNFQDTKILSLLNQKPALLDSLRRITVMMPLLGEIDLTLNVSDLIPLNWVVSGYPWYSISNDLHSMFVDEYSNRWDSLPSYSALMGYITCFSVINAIANASDLSGESIVRTIEDRQLNSPLGSFFFTKEGHESTLGVFVGVINVKQDKKIMDKWRYFSGNELMKIDQSYYDLFSENNKKEELKRKIFKYNLDQRFSHNTEVSLDNWYQEQTQPVILK